MNIIQKLTELFQKFPGIGPRQARRFVDFLVRENQAEVKKLAEQILELKKIVKQCMDCDYNFIPLHSEKKCLICQSPNRNKTQLLVVEKDVDLENTERANIYRGRYFVLGNTIKAFNYNQLAKKQFEKLFYHIKKNADEIKEIILATSATTEGEATALYLKRILEPLVKKHKMKISRLGRGLSTGTELEYSDSQTIKNALENRK